MVEFIAPHWLWLLLAILAVAVWQWRHRLGRPVLGDEGNAAGGQVGQGRERVALVLRVVAFALLTVALAGPLTDSRSTRVDVVFVVDVSESIDRDTAKGALNFVNRAIAEKPPEAQMGVVVFGANAGVERLLRDAVQPLPELSVDVRRTNTDIGRALEVALGTFPAGGQRRIVLLSDGQENVGRARSAAAVAGALGVQIHTVPLEPDVGSDEVRVDGLSVPNRVRIYEPFEVEMLLHSHRRATADLLLMRNGQVVHQRQVTLVPGDNAYRMVDQVTEAGLFEYEVILNSEVDGTRENNRYQTFVRVLGAPKILHLVDDPAWGAPVTEALRAQGLAVQPMPGDALPLTLHELGDYDLIVVNNISGFDISAAKMERIEEYVRDLGGGLLVLGGDKSYSGGGYYGTALERALPVSMDVRTEARIPSLAVTIVLDRSGSMAADDKLFIAKSAALAAIDVLNPTDEVAVLSFDDAPEWSVPPTTVANREAITARLRDIGSGGGTNLHLALQEALRSSQDQASKVKHLIILSDGLTDSESEFEELVRSIAAAQVTVSAVAFGADADQSLLESIAAWGDGRYYYTDDPGNVPRIFTSETLVVSRDLNVEKVFRPEPAQPGEILAGFELDELPALNGYQRALAKGSAQTLLRAAEDDPLLVTWRYGLGKSTAFMSDLSDRWGRRWAEWDRFPAFLGQIVRGTMRRGGSETMWPKFSWRGERGEVVVDVLDKDDRFINGLDMTAVAVGPSRTAESVRLEQIAPGRYRGEFSVAGRGRYYVSLEGQRAAAKDAPARRVGPSTYGLAIPYSAEFLFQGTDRPLLNAIATATGGRELPMTTGSFQEVFAPSAEAVSASARVWWPYLLAALLVFLAELAVRKLRLPAWMGGEARVDADPAQQAVAAVAQANLSRSLSAIRRGETAAPDDLTARARLRVSGRS